MVVGCGQAGRLAIQVKTSTAARPPRPTQVELQRLCKYSQDLGARPILAQVRHVYSASPEVTLSDVDCRL